MSQNIVRLRGLPWQTQKDEITRFLSECVICGGNEGIHFTFSREGRPSGEAFVELESDEDVTHALAQNREHIGTRYIEVFKVDRSEMDYTLKHSGEEATANQKNSDAVVKLRGLPFGCSKEEVSQFFSGLTIVPNGIMLPEERPGRSTGEAYVQFASPELAEKALKKHKERIGHRYIEIFNSTMNEAESCARGGMRPLMCPRPGPYDRGERGFGMGMGMSPMGMGMGFGRGRGGRNLKGFYDDEYDDFGYGGGMGFGGGRNRRGGGGGGGSSGGGGNGRGSRSGMGLGSQGRMQSDNNYVSQTGHSVHMRGLPYSATNNDIFSFFEPLQPVRCELEFDEYGRPSGEANVDFVSHQDALAAMKKHKSNMQKRYIELFLDSEPVSACSNTGSGGGYGSSMGGGGYGNNFQDDMGPLNNVASNNDGAGFRGYNSGSQGFGSSQGFGNQSNSGFGNAGGYGGQGMNNYDVGGGYGDGMGNSGGLMDKNYTAF